MSDKVKHLDDRVIKVIQSGKLNLLAYECEKNEIEVCIKKTHIRTLM